MEAKMSNYEFWNDLGAIFEAVLAYQKKNIEFNKTFISPWVQLGNIFQQPDSAQKTLQALQRAAELGPENAQNWADLGDAFFKMGSYEEAVDAYGKTIKLDPSAAWPKSNLALTLATQGKYQEATQLYRESLEGLLDDRDKAVTWNHLGNAYRKLGDFENAVAAFLRADELNTKTSPKEFLIQWQITSCRTPNPQRMSWLSRQRKNRRICSLPQRISRSIRRISWNS
jgi:tetratricopeptide (TPR) repeat protein